MTVSKGADGKEFVILVVYDGFSNVMQAIPLSSKDHHAVKECLLKSLELTKERFELFASQIVLTSFSVPLGDWVGCQKAHFHEDGPQ